MDLYLMKAKVVSVYDGDTVTLAVKWLDMTKECRVRLARVNTPEMNSKDPEQLSKAIAAKEFLQSILSVGLTVIVQSHILDKYGRILGTIYLKPTDKICINDMLLAQGYAEPVSLNRQIREIEKGLLTPLN